MASELVALLARLRRENRQQAGLNPKLAPPDVESGLCAAADVAAALGWRVGGWKIAAMKAEMQRALRTDAPILGRVYEQFVVQGPAAFASRKLLDPLAEIEFVVKLGENLPARARPYTQDEVADSVESLHPGMEIAECRFIHNDNFPPLPAIIADGSGSGSIDFGAAIPDWQSQNIAAQEVVLRINGAERRRGNAAAAIGHPLAPLTWLANELSRAGIGLRAGEMISTGTLTGMIRPRPGDEHVADFGPLGEVRVTF